MFADLHLSGRTADRAFKVLSDVRSMAVEMGARVVFLGDFWDARNTLPVRLVDRLMLEMEQWEREGVRAWIIPGNHDQVTRDGMVHGLRILEPFGNLTVCHEPEHLPEERVAFLPWREDPGEQAAQVEALDGNADWLVFAHAEIEGATTNHKHLAAGRVSLALIRQHARLFFSGHYHKRQLLGDRAWYVGSPFQQDFGERDDPPKGVCFLPTLSNTPQWVELKGFPKHHRVTWTPGAFEAEVWDAIAPGDIVELYHPRDVDQGELDAFIEANVAALDVRPLPLADAPGEDAPPAFALTLDQALAQWVADSPDNTLPEADLLQIGRGLLAEAPDAATVQPMSPVTRIVSVEIEDFAAISGRVHLNLEQLDLTLLRGPVGVGKTAVLDAITWGLYGQTSPRKAGSATHGLRGDEVVNDDAKKARVRVALQHLDGTEFVIDREKRRGKGAVVAIDAGSEGWATPDGIDDQQDLVNRIVGLPYSLWRACVSLGQGAVASFATEADTARKTLLNAAFGLDALPHALKAARSRLKPLQAAEATAAANLMAAERALEENGRRDFSAASEAWEQARVAQLQGVQAKGAALRDEVTQIAARLEGRAAWAAQTTDAKARLAALMAQLRQGQAPSAKVGQIQQQLGGIEAERGMVQRELTNLRADPGGVRCPTCGQQLPPGKLQEITDGRQRKIAAAESSLSTLAERARNLQAQLSSAQSNQADTSGLVAEIEQVQAEVSKLEEGVRVFEQIESRKLSTEERLVKARAEWSAINAQVNPYGHAAAEQAARAVELRAEIEKHRAMVADCQRNAAVLAYWAEAFGPKGLPVLVLRTVLHELEGHANRFLASVLGGSVVVRLALKGDALTLGLRELKRDEWRDRRYEQLSGGQRRCVDLAFSPWGLGEMVFGRAGVRVPLLLVDEITTHLGAQEKPQVIEALRQLKRESVLIVDHDVSVQGEFDRILELHESPTGHVLEEAW
jgi:ABC-type branched-subunit amino acid transport system ATPase component